MTVQAEQLDRLYRAVARLGKPFFDDCQGRVLYHGDAVAMLGEMQPESVGVFLIDPPYGTKTNQRDEWMVGEFSNVMPMVIPQLRRVGVKNAACYAFSSFQNIADWIYRLSPYFRMQNLLVWDKERHSGTFGSYSWQFHWEAIYYGIAGPRKILDYQPDVLRCNEKLNYAMQKPAAICKRLITASAEEDEIILDCFAGTGSSLVAAKQLGRCAVGIEIEEHVAQIAANRLRQEVLF